MPSEPNWSRSPQGPDGESLVRTLSGVGSRPILLLRRAGWSLSLLDLLQSQLLAPHAPASRRSRPARDGLPHSRALGPRVLVMAVLLRARLRPLSAPQPLGAAASQPLGAAASRPLGAAASRHLGLSAPRPLGTSASRPLGAAASRHLGLSAPRPLGTSASRPLGLSASRRRSLSASRRRSLSAPRPLGTSASRHLGLSASRRRSLSAPPPLGTSASRHLRLSASRHLRILDRPPSRAWEPRHASGCATLSAEARCRRQQLSCQGRFSLTGFWLQRCPSREGRLESPFADPLALQ